MVVGGGVGAGPGPMGWAVVRTGTVVTGALVVVGGGAASVTGGGTAAAADTGATVTCDTVGCPKVCGGKVSLKFVDAAWTTIGASCCVVTVVVLTMTLPATMLLMITWACMHTSLTNLLDPPLIEAYK